MTIRAREHFTHNSLYPPCSLLRYQYSNHKSLATHVVVNEELREDIFMQTVPIRVQEFLHIIHYILHAVS